MPRIPQKLQQTRFHDVKPLRSICFVVPGDPIPKARPRVTRRGTYTEKRTKGYEEAVGWAYREAGGGLHEGDMGLRVTFWRRTRQRVDLDNLVKNLMDGLNGIAWKDDGQVVYLEASKNYDAGEPCAEVEIWEWTKP